MNCNNTNCLWNFNNQCCSEDEEKMNKAIPNTLDCPSSLRRDFEQQLNNLFLECNSLLRKRNMKEMIEIKKIIESQRKG